MNMGNNFVSGSTNDQSYSRIRETIHGVVNISHGGTADRALVFNQKQLELKIICVAAIATMVTMMLIVDKCSN